MRETPYSPTTKIKYFTLLCLITLLLVSQPVQAEAPNAPLPVEIKQPVKKARVKSIATINCEPYIQLIEKYDWPVKTMLGIMKAESGCRHLAVNNNPKTKDHSVGLFQVNIYGNLKHSRPSEEELKIPEKNIEYAYQIYKTQGLKAWSVYTSGAYLN